MAAAGAWSLYQRYSTETQPYTVVAHVGDAELRRYEPSVVVETTATSEREAFGRLVRYIGGENDGDRAIDMTTPVEVAGPERGTALPTGGPIEVSVEDGSLVSEPVAADAGSESGATAGDGVRMAFHLPGEYDLESAPTPTDDAVEIVAVPERTLAVRRFSWRPSAGRVNRASERLLADLETASVPVSGEPFFMGYDAPGTLPFLRRNEVAVEVDSGPTGR